MKKLLLLSVAGAWMLTWNTSVMSKCVGTGISMSNGEVPKHVWGCEATTPPQCPGDPGLPITMWGDAGMMIATAADAAAAYAQREKHIDARSAIKQLEDDLGNNSGGMCPKRKARLEEAARVQAQAAQVIAPEIIADAVTDECDFDALRETIEYNMYVPEECPEESEEDTCNEDKVLEMQNSWLLTAAGEAAGAADGLLARMGENKEDMKAHFEYLRDHFNSQDTPSGMWRSSTYITLDSQLQQDDVNLMYANELVMMGLRGVRESTSIHRLKRR